MLLKRCVLLGALIVAALLVGSAAASERERPNILLIVADDLCWRDLGCMGNRDVSTPHLDTLAREGMTLRRMFTSSTTCSPSRHELLTGLYPVRSGAYPNHSRIDAGTKSLFTHLRDAGYRTGLQGKRHIHPPSSFPCESIGNDPDDSAAFATFIQRDTGTPWFVLFASDDPHAPWTRGPQEKFAAEKLRLPPYLHDNEITRRSLAKYYAEIAQLDEQVGKCLAALDRAGQRQSTLVLFVSEQGNSLPYGGKWSLYDNGVRTTSLARWPGHVRPGSSSDALVQYADVTPTLLAAAGIDPTKVDTGCPDGERQTQFDGRSFLPILTGRETKHRDYVFGQHTTIGLNGYREPYPMRSARDQRYKLIVNLLPQNSYWIAALHGSPEVKSWKRDAEHDVRLAARVEWLSHRPGEELYDLQADPEESINLATNPGYQQIKRRLRHELDAWMRQQGDLGIETESRASTRQQRAQAK